MLAFTLMLLAHSACPQDPAPGIDRGLAADRANLIKDVQYDLRFELSPNATEVSGEVWMRFRLPEDRDLQAPLVIDFAGTALTDVRVNDKDAELRAVPDHVLVPTELLVRGQNGIAAKFRSAVAPTGTPLSVYRDPADGREYYYTLVVPADAHRLYPCFDQPDLRARFQVTLDVPAEWTAISNTDVVADESKDLANGRRWAFRRSKPLPTYLMAFACGPFATIAAPPPQAAGIDPNSQLRLFARASQLPRLDRETVFRLHDQGLRWLANEFGVPYPFDKLDLVLLPGFPYGGMEHAGAIFYRETAILFDHPPTAAELVRRSTLVYHELSHQWFGNLVTMKWFSDLWLKEGFATFIAYQALEALEPGQKAWLRFLQRVKPRAYEVDGTLGTTPVFQELQNLADAKSAYGAIVYNKAPAVLRELHDRLGAPVFREGLQRYLKKHAFGNAEWRDLAAALEGAAKKDLSRWSERWLLAPSMPQVRAAWTADKDGIVQSAELTQHAIGGDGTWPLQLELMAFEASGKHETLTVTSDAAKVSLDALLGKPAPVALLANPQDVAYGQFVPDATSRAWLLENVAVMTDPLVRAVAMAGLLEAVREAELDPALFANTALQVLARERDADTHGWLLEALGTCLHRYLTPARAAPLQQRTTALLLGQLRNENDSGRELSTFRFLVRTSTEPEVLDLCRAVVAGAELPKGLAPGKQDCFLAVAALLASGKATDELQRLKDRFAKEDLGKELFLALAATPTEVNKQDYWRQYMQLDAPPEQWTQDSLAWFHWPGQEALTLPFLKLALEKVDWVKTHRRIFFMPAWLDGFINGHSSPEALAIVDAFLAATELSDDVRRKLLQSRDGLSRAVKIRRTFGD
jgi:aminopeptidase N